jgi:hypothetical protein
MRHQRDLLTARIYTVLRDIRTRKALKEIIGRAILLKDDDDVLDRRYDAALPNSVIIGKTGWK